jgi:DNA-binding NarL/FixJ family response regulator
VGTDSIQVLEAVYSSAVNEHEWADRLVETSRGLFSANAAIGLQVVEHDEDFTAIKQTVAAGPFATPDHWRTTEEAFAEFGADLFRAYYYFPAFIAHHSEVTRSLAPHQRELVAGYLRGLGVRDTIGLVAHPVPGVVVVLFVAEDKRILLSRHQRTRLSQIAVHIETSYRLRRRPGMVRAILDDRGNLVERTKESHRAFDAALTHQLHNIELARSAQTRTSDTALDLWPALVAGEVSLVEQPNGSRRQYLVIENAPERKSMRALSPGEIDVVSLSTRGLSAKLIAYTLGISAPTVSSRLAAAASKLGLMNRLELVRFAALLTRGPHIGLPTGELSQAEREVLNLLCRGLSNREIAAVRKRSIRTIANQVAHLLRKTQSPSRRALITCKT